MNKMRVPLEFKVSYHPEMGWQANTSIHLSVMDGKDMDDIKSRAEDLIRDMCEYLRVINENPESIKYKNIDNE